MAKYTPNYNLAKPEGPDNITPVIFANNFDIIDNVLSQKVGTADLGEYATTESLRLTNLRVTENEEKIKALVDVYMAIDASLDAINNESVGDE